MQIDLRQLRHLIALADHRSFVAAAGAVNLSQSAFSRSIQALEHSVGCQLVDRSSKELSPTRQGLVVLEHARRLVSGAYQLSNEIRQFTSLEAGELHFGCVPALAGGLVPKAIAGFIERYPKARVRFETDDTVNLGKRLLAEGFEFFLADCREFEGDPAYRVLRLRSRTWRFHCRAGHPVLEHGHVSAQELQAWPLAVTAGEPSLAELPATIECADSQSLRGVVLGSNAIGVSHGDRGLVRLKVEGWEVSEARYGIVSRARQRLSPLAEAMVERVLETDQAEAEMDLGLVAV